MLTFRFSGVDGTMTVPEILTSGMVGKQVKFELSPEWDSLRKTAVYMAGSEVRITTNVGEVDTIPAEVLARPEEQLYVGIYGVSADGKLVIPTIRARGPVIKPGARPSGDPSTNPTLPVWAQALAAIGDLEDLETEDKSNLVAAVNEAAKTGDGGSSDVYILAEGETLEDAPAEADIVIDPNGEPEESPDSTQAGEDGGYYTPTVTQTDETTATFSFTPSKEGMPAVADKNVTLPAGPTGPQGPAGADYVLTDADKTEIAELAAALVDQTDAVLYTDQTLTSEQKARARKNIGAVSMDDLMSAGGESVEDIEIVATEGKFAKWETGSASGGAESSVSWAAHSQFIQVNPGETLRITCRAANSCPGVVFYSTNTMSANYAISYALENRGTGESTGSVNRDLYTDEDVVVPDGAAYAILNNSDAYGGWKCQKVTVSSGSGVVALGKDLVAAEYEISQLERRVLAAEKHNDFVWGTFDKPYFVFVHDDSREFITTAYNAFHAKGVPLSSAAIAPYLENIHEEKTVKEWLDLIVADGGEVLLHYSYDLHDSDDDSVWYKYVVEAKQEFERNGFNIRGLILAGSSDVNSVKGEKFCRRYFDYADKVGTSAQYNIGRKLMLNWESVEDFKTRIDECAKTPGIYAFGFHGNRDDETWITEDSLKEIIDYISAKGNCEITTYSAVFDSIGTTVLEKRIAALEA